MNESPRDVEDLKRQAKALSYIPCLLEQLDDTGREMFGEVMQAQREGGYHDGFRDASNHDQSSNSDDS